MLKRTERAAFHPLVRLQKGTGASIETAQSYEETNFVVALLANLCQKKTWIASQVTFFGSTFLSYPTRFSCSRILGVVVLVAPAIFVFF